MTAFKRKRRSRGAALAEFAIIAPLLFLLVFGVIEFGYAFVQYLDVRHGAREAGRLAAVNYRPDASLGTAQTDDIIDETCTRLDSGDDVSITIALDGSSAIGQKATVTVSRDYTSLTGFFNFVSLTFDSTVEIRLEQEATWATHTKACP